MAKKLQPLSIIVDSREQLPYRFGFEDTPATTVVAKLDQGDYAVLGLQDQFAVERKSLPDLFASIGRERDRFEAEIERLNRLHAAAVVFEAELYSLATNPPARTALDPKIVIRTIASWSVRYPRVHWWGLPGRSAAERFTYRLLGFAAKNLQGTPSWTPLPK